MAVEVILLLVEGREIPVAIEAGLADRDDTHFARERDNALPVAELALDNVIGLHADGRVNSLEFSCQTDADRACGRGCSDRDDVRYAGLMSPRNDLGPIGVEFRLIKMGVRIEELHDLDESRRVCRRPWRLRDWRVIRGRTVRAKAGRRTGIGVEIFERLEMPLCDVEDLLADRVSGGYAR